MMLSEKIIHAQKSHLLADWGCKEPANSLPYRITPNFQVIPVALLKQKSIVYFWSHGMEN